MLREHKTIGRWLRFYEPTTSSIVSLVYGESGFVGDTKVQYSLDGESWTEYHSGHPITIAAGDPDSNQVFFRAVGDNRPMFSDDPAVPQTFGRFFVTQDCKCSGDVMYLLDSEGRANIAYNSVFKEMFRETKITTAPEISATELNPYCFQYMFYSCGSLQTPMAELPAAVLYHESYGYMFESCGALQSTPDLKFTQTATNSCYRMFKSCSSITSVFLRNTDLTENCFFEMFSGCSSLNHIKCRFITWPEYRYNYHTEDDQQRENATYNWTEDVAAVGTFERDYRLPLYINDQPTNGIDSGSGEVFNWDDVHDIPYDTSDMYHFDPWVGKESNNLTTIPPCAVRYRTKEYPKDGTLTVRFNFLSNYAVAGNSDHIISEDLQHDASNLDGNDNAYSSPRHAGDIQIEDYLKEIFNTEDIFYTPDYDVVIDWGDGTKTVIPALKEVSPSTPFSSSSSPGQPIGGIFEHQYTSGASGEKYIITVCSTDINADDEFFTTITSSGRKQFKGCMPPLCALRGSNIEALLTPLLPIYGGLRSDELFYPLMFMFYGNTDLISVPQDLSGSMYGFMFAKNAENLKHPFGAARMFEGCTGLANTPTLKVCNPDNGLIEPAIPVNSLFEGMFKNCTSINSVELPNTSLSPYMLAEFLCGASSLKNITCYFSEWPDYEVADPNIPNCRATFYWTKDVYDEYGDGGTFTNPMTMANGLPVSSVMSQQGSLGDPDEHEYNPWKPKTLPDDWYITFTNNQNTTKTIGLRNHRKLFASLTGVGDARTLDVIDGDGHGHTVSCHIHLLEYRKSLNGTTFGPWLKITDDDLSNGIIHAGQYESNLDLSGQVYKFQWSIDIDPGQIVQLRGVPCTVGPYRIDYSSNPHKLVFKNLSTSNSWWDNAIQFDDTPYFGLYGEAGYYKKFNSNDIQNETSQALHQVVTSYEQYDIDSNTYGYNRILFLGNRMFTGIAINGSGNSKMHYQFVDCDDLDVTGFIDTFFDYLDLLSNEFVAPPLTYYRLFKDTGILSAPKIYAGGGSDRGEFCECFAGCTKLTAPALFNIARETFPMNPNAPGLAKPLRANYNTGRFCPPVLFPAFSGLTESQLESTIGQTDGGFAGDTSSFILGNYKSPGAVDTAEGHVWEYVPGNIVEEGAFESMYEGCTSLQWPMVNTGSNATIPRQMSVFFNQIGPAYAHNPTFKRMFYGCTSIGSFGLVVYSKQNLTSPSWEPLSSVFCWIVNMIDNAQDEYRQMSNLHSKCFREMFAACSADENSDYLWNCWYTNAGLKYYTNGGNKDGTLASWEGSSVSAGPYQSWLDGTNVAKIYTNCGDRSGDTQDFTAISRGISHCGACDNQAWEAARLDHQSEYGIPQSNYHKTWPRWNSSPFSNIYMLTWCRDENNNEISIER